MIKSNIDYEVGDVRVNASWMEPEQTAIWHVEASMVEIGLTLDIRVPLLEKIQLLINKTVKKASA